MYSVLRFLFLFCTEEREVYTSVLRQALFNQRPLKRLFFFSPPFISIYEDLNCSICLSYLYADRSWTFQRILFVYLSHLCGIIRCASENDKSSDNTQTMDEKNKNKGAVVVFPLFRPNVNIIVRVRGQRVWYKSRLSIEQTCIRCDAHENTRARLCPAFYFFFVFIVQKGPSIFDNLIQLLINKLYW